MLKFWELAPSPNNTKVRMALCYKGVDFEAVAVDPSKRDTLIEISGQEATPVIADKGIVLNDSEAILQYLDANYPDSPRLFPGDKENRRVCDNWKTTLDEKVAQYWAPVFFYIIRRREELDKQALKSFQDSLCWLNEEIGDKEHIQEGEDMAVCDLRVAEWATYALPSDGLIERVPLFGKSKKVFAVEEGSLGNLERYLTRWNRFLE
jgi:glutathione S-transferase